MRWGWLPILIIISFPSVAAIKRAGDELSQYRSEVIVLGARLSTLEKEIASKNNLYLSSLEDIRKFESDIHLYREALKKKQNEVQEAKAQNKKILQNYLLESETDAIETWQRRVHLLQ